MVVVLVVAAGRGVGVAGAAACSTATPGVVVLKRCVDVDDLLAAATAGQADVAVVALDAPGLDPAAVDHLRRHHVRPVAVVPPDAADDVAGCGPPGSASRTLVADDGLDALPDRRRRPPPRTPAPTRPCPTRWPTSRRPPRGARPRGRGLGPGRRARAARRVAVAVAAELARRGLRTTLVDADPYGGAVAQQLGILDEVSGLLAAARLAAGGHARGAVRLGAAGGRRAPDRGHRPAAAPTAGSRSAPAPSSTSSRSRAAHGDVVVDTGFSLEDDPAGDFGARPAAQPDDPGRARGRPTRWSSSARPTRSGSPGWRAALVELRERDRPARRCGWWSTGCGRSLGWSEKRHRRHGRGVRPAGRAALPARRPADRRPGPGRRPDRSAEVGDSPLAPRPSASSSTPLRPPVPARRGRRAGAGSGGEQQVEPADGEGHHRHQQRQLAGELVLLRAAA